ncbi:DUF1236 domain-containing protein [Labrys sp. 22185]|uniref:DUF1236 domain-containing protein n=1 Tax=Labrys sp. 22185 TaxID=3453888 RepID=UPI003F85097A
MFVTVAAAALTAVLATGTGFAQDEILPKRQQPQQAPAMQQEPANKMEVPGKKPRQSEQELNVDQPRKKPAAQTEDPGANPASDADQAKSAERKQTDRARCSAADANCTPSKSQKTGDEQPSKRLKPGKNLDQSQPEEQPVRQKTRPADESAPQPAEQSKPERKQPLQDNAGPVMPGAKPSQQTGETRPGGTDVDVVGSLNVPKEKASRVRDMLFRSSERSNVDIDVNINVGRTLPARVRPRPLPPDIVEIVPEYRSYDYVVVRDEIVIVEPRSRKVVEVIRKGGGATHARATSKIRLTAEQRRIILDYARERHAAKVERSFDAQSGVSVPAEVELAPMPDAIVTEVPVVRSYDFFVDQNDDVVLVDPGSRAVVEVIQ